MNDADLDMLALVEAGNLIAKAICPICEEPVDPMDPRWDDLEIRTWRTLAGLSSDEVAPGRVAYLDGDRVLVSVRLADDPIERGRYAQILGPSTQLDGFHDSCLDGDDDFEALPVDPDSIGRYADCDVPPAWFDPSICGESWDGE